MRKGNKMERLKCTIQYDGSFFSGFQIQPGKRTIQGIIEDVLMKMHKGRHIRIHPSGRTDGGAHAIGQTIHFDSPYDIPLNNWKQALNTLLPDDVYVKEVEKVQDTFHARYDVVEKEYRYYVLNEAEPNVFKRNYAYFFPYVLDISSIQQACRYFEGTHDFTTFSSAKAETKGSRERTLYQVSCEKRGSEIEFIFRGNGFLYNMVRIIVGFLLDVGQGKRNQDEIEELFAKKDRRLAGDTAPPQGLYLWRVTY